MPLILSLKETSKVNFAFIRHQHRREKQSRPSSIGVGTFFFVRTICCCCGHRTAMGAHAQTGQRRGNVYWICLYKRNAKQPRCALHMFRTHFSNIEIQCAHCTPGASSQHPESGRERETATQQTRQSSDEKTNHLKIRGKRRGEEGQTQFFGRLRTHRFRACAYCARVHSQFVSVDYYNYYHIGGCGLCGLGVRPPSIACVFVYS